jgi:hypothetical protein
MSKAWSGGSTREWRRIRAIVMEHNRVHYGGQCRARVRGLCTGVAAEAHHTLGREVTGDDPRFIEGVCQPCNVHIGNPVTHPKSCALCADAAWADHEQDLKPRVMTDW